MGVKNFHNISERGPEILKLAIKDVFKRVAVVLIQCHPSIFFCVVDRKVCLGYKSAGEGAARENPVKLNAEHQEKTVDMAGKIFMQLDAATFKCGISRWKIRFSPGEMTIIIVVCSASHTTSGSTASGLSVIIVIRHVTAAAAKTREVNAGATGNGKSTETVAIPGSEQTKREVSVRQRSLIR